MKNSFEVNQYFEDVLSGKQVACKYVQQMAKRHLNDLENGSERGLYFDEDAAERVISFFKFIRHSKGEWAGQTVTLEAWEKALLWVLFGWKREDGTRRFRTGYFEIARKNGKSFLLSGIGLYLLDADGEPGAEIYTAATKRDQARITHGEATRMVKSSPSLRKRLRVVKDNIHNLETASKFEPLGRDSDSLDGLNVHGVIADEVHAWRSRDMWDVLDTATGARRQPLLLSITTAGFDRSSFCWELHEYTEKVLAGIVEDDSHFGVIYTIDEGDDWQDESVWVKANPNLGVSVKIDDLRRKAAKAKELPSALNAFLRLHLNVWTQAESRWIDIEKWLACGIAVNADGLSGRTCFGGLDLSRTTDITAFVLVFPPEVDSEPYQVLCRFFIPEEAMHKRSRNDGINYESWVRQGLITSTPGAVIDYKFIYQQIFEDAEKFDIREIAFDRWGASQVYQVLEDEGLQMVQFGQGFASMSAPMKLLEELVLSGKLSHGNNPVLNWMAGNLVTVEDASANIKPDKEKSSEKIDGMVALIMALSRASLYRKGSGVSVYNERGVLTL